MDQNLNGSGVLSFILLISFMVTSPVKADYVLEKTLHEFFPIDSQPTHPATRLVEGQDGNFYGTTAYGGTDGNGTVYRIASGGGFTVIYNFAGTNGAQPRGDLIQASNGILYGTTVYGSNPPFDSGTFFKVTTNGVLTTLFYFGGTNGSSPSGQLAQGTDGFYGSTRSGGANELGTLFKITTNGTFTLLHSFNGTNDGCYPSAGLIMAGDGNFYGMTPFGGNGFTDFSGNGTIFRMGTNGTFTTLVSFDANYVGSFKSRFTLGSDGQIYGVAGAQIFKMTTGGVITPLATFNGTNGNRSFGGITEGKDRNFYGITSARTDGTNSYAPGTIFRLTPDGALKSISYFNKTNADHPFGTFILARDGHLYAAIADEQLNVNLNGNSGAILRMVEPPKLTLTNSNNGIILTWTSFTNGVYRLEKTSSLDTTNWIAASSDIIAMSNSISVTNAPNEEEQEYFRAVLLP